MVQAVVAWRYIGRRITDPSHIAEVCVQAATSVGPGSEGGINRVEFYLSFNGGAPVTMTATTLEECQPNHATAPSLIPGAESGRLARFPGYRVLLPLFTLGDDYEYGTITITATAFSNAGTATPFDIPVTIHNDTDGTDRRPSTKDLWSDYDTGNDSTGDGSPGNPYKTLQRALTGEMGGSTVHLVGSHVLGGGPVAQWQTTGGHRVTIQWEPGAVFTRDNHTQLYCGTGVPCNFLFKGLNWLNHGCVINNDSVTTSDIWIDGGYQQIETWSPSKRWSVLSFRDDRPNGISYDGVMMKHTTTNANSRIHATCCWWRGVINGPNSFYSEQDCLVEDFLGIGSYFFDRHSACNCIIQGQRLFRDVAGRTYGNIALSIVTVPAAGQMRIDATAPLFFTSSGNNQPMDISTLAEIVGTSHQFRAQIQNSAAAGNNGTFAVLSAGAVGNFGFPYVVLANPSAVPGAPGTSTVIRTISTVTGSDDFVHPDVLYMAGNLQEGTFLYGITARDIDGAQTFFTSGYSGGLPPPQPNVQSRLCMWNCRDGGNFSLDCQQNGTRFLDCLFFNNTIEGFWGMRPFWGNATGTCFINNVVSTLQANGSDFWPGMLTVSHNHLINGTPAYGSNWTTGAWFATNPRASPWSFQPTPANIGTGSTLVPELTSRRWAGALAPTKGCLQDTGLFDWGSDSLGVTAPAIGTIASANATALTGALASAPGPAVISTMDSPSAVAATGSAPDVVVTVAAPSFGQADANRPASASAGVAASAAMGSAGDPLLTPWGFDLRWQWDRLTATASAHVGASAAAPSVGDWVSADAEAHVSPAVEAALGSWGTIAAPDATASTLGGVLVGASNLATYTSAMATAAAGIPEPEAPEAPAPSPASAGRQFRPRPWRVPKAARPSRTWRW